VNQVNVKYRNLFKRFNFRKSLSHSQDAAVNDDHEDFKRVTYKAQHGLIEFYFSEHGLSLRLKYEDFMSPSSVSLELGIEYLESEKSIIKLCELINPAQIYIKQGQETCKGGYKKFGWWLVIDDEKTSFQYRVGGIVKWSKVI
jgi:hypothetical protein